MSVGKAIVGMIITAAVVAGIYIGIQVKNFMNICFQIGKYKMTGIDLQYIYVDFGLIVYNPDGLEAHLVGYHFDVFINDKWVAKIQSKGRIRLASEESTTITIPIQIDYRKAFGVVLGGEMIQLFAQKKYDSINVRLVGKYTGQALGIKVPLDLDEKWTLADIVKSMSEPSVPCQKAA